MGTNIKTAPRVSTPRAGPSHDSSSRQAYSPEVMPSLGSAARTQKLCLADYPDSSKRSHATSPSPDRRNASGPSSAQTRKAPDQPRRLGKRDNIDHISTDELRDLTGSVYCRVPECPKKRASAAHGLCRDHRHKIADAFQGFYVATQNVVERLAIWDIKPLPEAQINNPFIRHCDHFINDVVPHWFEFEEALHNTETRKAERFNKEGSRKP